MPPLRGASGSISSRIGNEPTVRNWEVCARVIAEVAFEILVPLGVCLILQATLPVALGMALIPMAAIGLSFSCAFLFLGGGGRLPTAPEIHLPVIPLEGYRPRSPQ